MSTASYSAAKRGVRSRQWRAHVSDYLLQPLAAHMAMDNHISEREQHAALTGIENGSAGGFQGPRVHDADTSIVHPPAASTAACTAGHAKEGIRDTRVWQQSPFADYQASDRTPDPAQEQVEQTERQTPRERWQNAGKRIGPIRFGHSPQLSSDDTAHKTSALKPPELERKSSLFGRSSMNLSRLSRSFNDNRAGNSAMAETVKLAQQQQQANRQSAAPVLKAVPSTKVSSQWI